MSPLALIIGIVVVSAIAPFVTRLHKIPETWITLIVVNLIIISLYVVVRNV